MTSTSIYRPVQQETKHTTTKFCNTCGTEQSLTNFSKHKSKKDGLQTQCKQCCAAKEKVWKEANKEHIAAKDNFRYEANKEQFAAKNKAYREANKEQCAARDKAYRQNNPAKVNAYAAKRRAQQLQATPTWFPVEKARIDALYAEAERLTKETGIQHHVDHDAPLVSDLVCGLHCLANLRIITAAENCSKGNRTWPDMP